MMGSGPPASSSSSFPYILFLLVLALATLHGCANGQVVEATSRPPLPAGKPPPANATRHQARAQRLNVTGGERVGSGDGADVADVADVADGMMKSDSDIGGSVAASQTPPLTDERLRAELWGCRVMCRDEKWNPVCHRQGTFANECWVHCSTSVFSYRHHHSSGNKTYNVDDDGDEASSGGGPVVASSSTNGTDARAARANRGSNRTADRASTNATKARDVTTTPGPCDPSKERFRPDDHDCIQRCVRSWSEGGGGLGEVARWHPVCGEDGVTYTTACFADCSGVRSAEGECHDVSPLARRRRRR